MRKIICAQSIKNDRRCLSTHRLLKIQFIHAPNRDNSYMSETTDFMDSCTYNSPPTHISFKAIHMTHFNSFNLTSPKAN